MSGRLKRVLMGAGLVLGMLLLLLTLVMLTPAGARLAQPLLFAALPPQVSIERIQGALAGPLTFSGIRYQDGGVSVTVKQLQVQWQPTALLFGRAQVDGIVVNGVRAEVNPFEAPAASPVEPAGNGYSLAAPLAVRVEQLQVNDIQLQLDQALLPDGLESYPERIDQLQASAVLDHNGLRIADLSLNGPDITLRGSAGLPPSVQGKVGADFQSSIRIAPYAPLPFRLLVQGKLHSPSVVFVASPPYSLELKASIQDLMSATPQVQATLNANRVQLDAHRPDLPAILVDGTLSAEGDVGDIRLQPALTVTTAVPGVSDHTPVPVHLSGEVVVAGNEIALKQLGARIEPTAANSPAVDLVIDGTITRPPSGETSGQLALSWSGLQLPLGAEPVRLLQSAQGQLSIQGNAQRYEFVGEGSAHVPPLAASPWAITGFGERQQITLQALTLTQLGGELSLSGTASAGADGNFDLTLTGNALNPVALHPAFDGSADLTLHARGGQFANAPFVTAEIQRLAGTLRGQPLGGGGRLSWREGKFESEQLSLQFGQSELRLSGTVDQRADVQWSLRAPDLSTLLPGWAGALQGEGKLLGPSDALQLQANIQGDGIESKSVSVDGLSGDVRASLAAAGALDISLTTGAMRIADNTFEQASVVVDGRLDGHTLALTLNGSRANASATAKGGWQQARWQGDIEVLELSVGDERFALSAPAPVVLSASTGEIPPACIGDGVSSLCLSAAWSPAQAPVGSFDINAVPLSRFAPVLPPALTYNGIISATGELRADGDIARGNAQVVVSPGSIEQAEAAEALIRWDSATATVNLAANKLTGEAKVDLRSQGQLEATLAAGMQGFIPDQQAPLSAQVTGMLLDVPIMAALLPQVASLTGETRFEVSVNGTPAQPRINGAVNASKIAAAITTLGIDVTDGELNLQAREGVFELTGNIHAGEGQLQMAGEYKLADRIGTLTLSGADFLAIDTPELSLQISPDLTAQATGNTVDLSGSITVPVARIAPADLSGAVTVSEDQVLVVNGEEPEQTQAGWQISSSVAVTLGDSVNFDGYGLKARVEGDLRATDRPGEITIGSGELTILDGIYKTYGQELNIDRGRILYSQSPLANPGLDIIATRDARDDVIVNMSVRGSLREPVLALSTEPPSSQADALSYLVLGRPVSTLQSGEQALLDDAATRLGLAGAELLAQQIGRRVGLDEISIEDSDDQSRASLVIGKYLSPRLYVSYGLGLFETFNNLLVRYDLSERFAVQTQTGAEQSADLLFSVEK